MLLIYVSKLTNRLGYTLNLIFKSILHIPFKITLDKKYYCSYEGAKLCYAHSNMGDGLFIKADNLLFQTTIESLEIRMLSYEDMPAFFPVYGKELAFPFDVFAASFYLASRYEEYLPHHEDVHNRFEVTDSIAYQHHFLQIPIVNKWAKILERKIQERYNFLQIPQKHFQFSSTIDIDAAFSYKHKGFFRSLGGYFRDLAKHDFEGLKMRTQVLLGKEPDPFDTYQYIIDTSKKYHSKLLFFVLFADYATYDKNISYNNLAFQQLLKTLGDCGKIGIHPSYASFDKPELLHDEIQRISQVMHKPINRSRFHFLRFRLPATYQNLIENEIDYDYSMGYVSEYGFRAGICTPFHFYDLENDCETALEIYPFVVMDATLQRYKGMTPKEAISELKKMIDEIKSVEGTFYSIWHNNSLSEHFGWKGWREVYEQMLEYAYECQNK